MKSLGKYRLLANLGRGGMADILLAVGTGTAGFSKLQVIKRLREETAEEPEFVKMFLDEARLAARLNHPNVVQTFEVSESTDDLFMVMEYLDGVPVNRLLSRGRQRGEPLPLPMAMRIVCDALAGLHYAHELRDYDGKLLNVVHRDASPHNIFVTYDGQVKVLDFGIAKASTQESETKAGVVKGKISYMAPEQVRGSAVDRRTDVFILGVVLWEVLAGRKMWESKSEAEIIGGLMQGRLPSLAEAAPGVDPALVAICERCLEAEPDRRYASAQELRAALIEAQSRAGGLADHEELGRHVDKLFGEKREEIRRTIDEQLKGVAAEVELSSGPTPGDTGLSSLPSLSASKASGASAVSQSVGAATSVPEAPPPAPARSLGPVAVGASALLLALAAGALWMGRQPPAVPPAAAAVTSASPVVSAVAVAEPSTAATAVELTVHASPTTATLLLDGSPLPSNPFTGKFRRDGLQHQLRAEAADHRPVSRLISFDQNLVVDLILESSERGKGARPTGAAVANTTPPAATTAAAVTTGAPAVAVAPTGAPALPGAGTLGAAPSAAKRPLSTDGLGAPSAPKRKLGDNPFLATVGAARRRRHGVSQKP